MSAVRDALTLAKTTLLDKRQEVYNEAYNEAKERQNESFNAFYAEQQDKVAKQKAELDAAFSAAVAARQAEVENIAKAEAATKTHAIDEEIARLDDAIAKAE